MGDFVHSWTLWTVSAESEVGAVQVKRAREDLRIRPEEKWRRQRLRALSPDGATFACSYLSGCSELGPFDTVTMDSAGNLYGMEEFGNTQCGSVFELLKQHYYEPVYLHFFSDNGDGFFPMSRTVRAAEERYAVKHFKGKLMAGEWCSKSRPEIYGSGIA